MHKGLLSIAIPAAQAASNSIGFYKWRDYSGVLHITGHPSEVAAEVEVDVGSVVNKAPMGNLDFGFMGQNQGQAPGVDKALQDTINGLESELLASA